VTAGSQSGKTCFGPHWVRREVELAGGGDGGVVTASYPLLVQKVLPEMRAIFERLLGWEYRGGDSPRSAATLTRPEDGSRIFLSSAQTPQESGTWKWAWEDECGLPEFGMEADRGIQRRVQIHQGRILRTTTPYHWGWHKSEVWDRSESGAAADADYININFRSCDNPAYSMEEYERLKRELPDWYSAMFLDGLYTRPAGQIYRDFDEAVHVVRPFSIPPTWRRVVGVDFGPVNTCVVWLAEDPVAQNWYLYREAHGGGLDSAQHAREARRFRENVLRWVGGAPSEDEQRKEWYDAALLVVEKPPVSDVEIGINCVTAWLRLRKFYLFATCQGVIKDLKGYARELDAAGQATDKIANQREFHFCDATRYIVSSLHNKPLADLAAQSSDNGPYLGGATEDWSGEF